jgi:hypothetical protein
MTNCDKPRRAPLLRTTFTVTDPAPDDPFGPRAVTIHLLVLAAETESEHMARFEDDLPELQEAGWCYHGYGPLNVYMRTVG